MQLGVWPCSFLQSIYHANSFSVLIGSEISEDSDTTQIELEQMDYENMILFTDHWTESLAWQRLSSDNHNVTWEA